MNTVNGLGIMWFGCYGSIAKRGSKTGCHRVGHNSLCASDFNHLKEYVASRLI